jgi:hypothetical protein
LDEKKLDQVQVHLKSPNYLKIFAHRDLEKNRSKMYSGASALIGFSVSMTGGASDQEMS